MGRPSWEHTPSLGVSIPFFMISFESVGVGLT